MSRYVDGRKEPTTIFEAAAYHRRLRIECRICQRSAVFDPHQLWWLFERRRWSGVFSAASKRFWCRSCTGKAGERIKAARIALTKDEPTITLPYPDELTWKQAISRHRG